MSQPEDNPAEILHRFSNNLVERMGEEFGDGTDDLARQLVLALVVIVDAAANTAEQMEDRYEDGAD